MSNPAFDELVADFELFDDWEDRYRYVIELGKAMPELPETARVPANKVDGCASQVWLDAGIEDGGIEDGSSGAVLSFRGDSDAMIVRGLIAILHRLMSERPASEVATLDAHRELARLGLDEALSAQRSNGLRAMIARLQQIARATQPA